MKKHILTLLCSLAVFGLQARDIIVTGVVKNPDGDRLRGVIVKNSQGKQLGSTNVDGEYAVTVDDMGELRFSYSKGNAEDKTVKVNGQTSIDVVLIRKAKELDEIVVMGKANIEKVMLGGRARTKIHGNRLDLAQQVQIPDQIFATDNRAVLQPAVYDEDTRVLTLLTPYVIDGPEYAITQQRMYDDNIYQDTLASYRKTGRTATRFPWKRKLYTSHNTIKITDTLHIEDPNHSYLTIVYLTIEDYSKVFYNDAQISGAGASNPLQFLTFDIDPIPFVDPSYYPSPKLTDCSDKREVNITFAVGKDKLDLDLGNNREEIENIISQLKSIYSNPSISLKEFKIEGIASPEGRLVKNEALASNRLGSTVKAVTEQLPSDLLRGVKVSKNAIVASWTEVANLMRNDSLTVEADMIDQIVAKHSKPDDQFAAIRQLPFYNTILADTYLPRLRRVTYEISYTQRRELTLDEIKELYLRDPKSLTKYDIWKYYTSETNPEQKLKVMTTAAKQFPTDLLFCSDVTAELLKNKTPDDQYLAGFFKDVKAIKKDSIPVEVKHNYAVSALYKKHFSKADSIFWYMKRDPRFATARAYSDVINGRETPDLKLVTGESTINEAVVYLDLDENAAALAMVDRLGDTAVDNYIKAVIYKRNNQNFDYDDLQEECLIRAIELDPAMREKARKDQDLKRMLEDIEKRAQQDAAAAATEAVATEPQDTSNSSEATTTENQDVPTNE